MSTLPGWVEDHIELYQKDPQAGHMWDSSVVGGPGVIPCLLLTTVGRKSERIRLHPLIYGKENEGYVIIASKGGSPSHPAWYLNLEADPQVTIQVGPDIMKAKAEVVEGEQREVFWKNMIKIWPPYDDYQKKTDRNIPVVLLRPMT